MSLHRKDRAAAVARNRPLSVSTSTTRIRVTARDGHLDVDVTDFDPATFRGERSTCKLMRKLSETFGSVLVDDFRGHTWWIGGELADLTALVEGRACGDDRCSHLVVDDRHLCVLCRARVAPVDTGSGKSQPP